MTFCLCMSSSNFYFKPHTLTVQSSGLCYIVYMHECTLITSGPLRQTLSVPPSLPPFPQYGQELSPSNAQTLSYCPFAPWPCVYNTRKALFIALKGFLVTQQCAMRVQIFSTAPLRAFFFLWRFIHNMPPCRTHMPCIYKQHILIIIY